MNEIRVDAFKIIKSTVINHVSKDYLIKLLKI
jgi:hypothetical protein